MENIGLRMRLGDLLIREKLLTEKQLEIALNRQKATGRKLGEILTNDNFVKEKDIIRVLQIQLKIPYVELEEVVFDSQLTQIVSEALARKYNLVPIKQYDDKIVIAMSDPLNIFAIDDVRIATGFKVETVIAMTDAVNLAIDKLYTRQKAEQAVEDFTKQLGTQNSDELEAEMDIMESINKAPIVQLVNSIIDQAVIMRASDIHIEPFEKIVRIRYRIDGELQTRMNPSKATHGAIVTRIKIMCNLDIAERRKPQDGRYEYTKEGQIIDLRISIIPTVFGEKIVIRLLDRSSFLLSKRQLGFSEGNLEVFEQIIHAPHGIILVTGPTGSGKTTTLYTVLNELNTERQNIITLEDPVEYRMDGVNQVQVNPKAGVNFTEGLRSILRQDPNIIMIGEIRDAETAQIAIRAAITGHLVISTLHTNDAASTISRLLDMGIESYLLSSALVGIVSQRLVRKICENCKESYEIDDSEKNVINTFNIRTLWRGRGCSKCHGTGYKGRIGIHEIITIDKDIKLLMEGHASTVEIKEAAIKKGMIDIAENCRELVLEGITTVAEYSRVIYSID